MKNTKNLLIIALVIVCIVSLVLVLSANMRKENGLADINESDAYSQPDPVKKQPLTQEEIDRIAQEKQGYEENTSYLNENSNTSESDLIPKEETEKSEKYMKLQAENDKKAIDSLSRYFETDFSGISETSVIIQPDNSIITVTTKEQIELYKKMLAAIQSEKLDYSEVKPMILYLAYRGDEVNEVFKDEPSFMLELEKAIAPFLESDPSLGHDIEVAYDPMYFGD